jgi:diketogulonate reductase-like aldo/keto reductase
MKSLNDSYILSNGVKIPCIGFGTWQTPSGEIAVKAVQDALSAGYRHIDTAAAYLNEQSVGIAVRASGLPRESIFITSKLDNKDHGYHATLKAFEKTMNNLNTDYLDLYLIHWPNPIHFRDRWQKANAESWMAFEELYQARRIRSIGISNFMPHHIEALEKTAKVMPMVNQIRLCPGETQDETAVYCRARNILLEAYSPLGTGLVFEIAAMQDLAQKYHKTIAQVCLRWSLQMGYLPLPKSVRAARIRENADVFDFELAESDVALIAGMSGACGSTYNPDKTNF